MARAIHLREAVSVAGRFPLLAGVTLDVEIGEVLHLRGPNGAGKTSLLRVLAGLLPVASGEAVVLGHDLRSDRTIVRAEIGLLGHAGFLYDDLTVMDNVAFAVRAARRDPLGIDAALGRLDLTGRLVNTTVNRLSAGQRRRVALAILVARAPRLWLLDEPHAGLDADGRDVVDDVVREARDGGATVVMSSHENDRAHALADRTVDMAGGQIILGSRAPQPPGAAGLSHHSAGGPGARNAAPPRSSGEVDCGVA
jgi:heme ABC exporter ATP-binding subunit CcmA